MRFLQLYLRPATGAVSLALVLALIGPELNAETTRQSLQERLNQTLLQRQANQSLMWAAAEDFGDGALQVATGKNPTPGPSAQTLTKLTDIGRGIAEAARKQDASTAARLIAEGGRLIFIEIAKTAKGSVATAATAGSVVVDTSFGTLLQTQAAVIFAQRAADDRRLRDSEISLEHQLERVASEPSASNTTPPRPASSSSTSTTKKTVSDRDSAALDDAITLMRFRETKDWTVEDIKNMTRIAASYPDIKAELRQAIARTKTLAGPELDSLPSEDGQLQQLTAAAESAGAAHSHCVYAQVPACINECESKASSMPGSYISNVQACVHGTCDTMCDALLKAWDEANKRLSDYNPGRTVR